MHRIFFFQMFFRYYNNNKIIIFILLHRRIHNWSPSQTSRFWTISFQSCNSQLFLVRLRLSISYVNCLGVSSLPVSTTRFLWRPHHHSFSLHFPLTIGFGLYVTDAQSISSPFSHITNLHVLFTTFLLMWLSIIIDRA